MVMALRTPLPNEGRNLVVLSRHFLERVAWETVSIGNEGLKGSLKRPTEVGDHMAEPAELAVYDPLNPRSGMALDTGLVLLGGPGAEPPFVVLPLLMAGGTEGGLPLQHPSPDNGPSKEHEGENHPYGNEDRPLSHPSSQTPFLDLLRCRLLSRLQEG